MTASADLDRAAAELARFPDQAVRAAVTDLKRAIMPSLRRATGGDYRLSRARPQGKLTVNTRVTGSVLVEGKVSAGPKKMRGPWRWIEDGTRPHVVNGRQHPGHKGKQAWSEPLKGAMQTVERDIGARFDAVLR